MDIQKMVDDRLEELLARQYRVTPVTPVEDDLASAHRRAPAMPARDEFAVTPRRARTRRQRSDVMELTLAEIAERILAVTDQLAGDYARMEKDILDSRLTVLQSAEAVLDIAISLRRKAQAIINEETAGRIERRRHVADGLEDFDDAEDYETQEGRVSMHDLGVASLFRRT